jgi:hypothetical protein
MKFGRIPLRILDAVRFQKSQAKIFQDYRKVLVKIPERPPAKTTESKTKRLRREIRKGKVPGKTRSRTERPMPISSQIQY